VFQITVRASDPQSSITRISYTASWTWQCEDNSSGSGGDSGSARNTTVAHFTTPSIPLFCATGEPANVFLTVDATATSAGGTASAQGIVNLFNAGGVS
jgi:hypothetical protein